jgi:hypothetical protein
VLYNADFSFTTYVFLSGEKCVLVHFAAEAVGVSDSAAVFEIEFLGGGTFGAAGEFEAFDVAFAAPV